MHLRFWVYRRNLSSNPASPFRSNAHIMQKAGCCISGFLGFIFLALALMCLFSPEADKDGKLFLIFVGLFAICETISFIYSCIPWFQKYCKCSDNEEEQEISSRSLLSSEESSYEEIPGYQGYAAYQACTGYPEVPSYQAGPSYREVPNHEPAPYGAEGGFLPGLTCLRPLVNYEGVLVYQQIPIYHQDLLEPQLPPYSPQYSHRSTSPQKEILVY